MLPDDWWHQWSIAAPLAVHELTQGANNAIWRVDTSAGRYVLRVYRNHHDDDRVRDEHDILARLQRCALPFAVPAPLATSSGATMARLAADGAEALATLAPFISGDAPDVRNSRQAFAAGAALGMLDDALAQSDPPAHGITLPTMGDLTQRHSLVPDPFAAIASLPVDESSKHQLAVLYTQVMATAPHLYATLPRQVIHNDCDASNILMDGTRVTGIIDFEFCGHDLRAMDLLVPLYWWPLADLGSGDEWRIIDALGHGYTRQVRLTPDEIAALPDLYQLRSAATLLHRIGRFRQGLGSAAQISQRVRQTLRREAWLMASRERLLASAQQW